MRTLLFFFSLIALTAASPAASYTSADDRFEYTLENGEATITRYKDETRRAEVRIPSSVDGHPVVAVGEKAFQSAKPLCVPNPDDGLRVALFIPDSVRSIGKDAFSGCNALSTVVIPGSVKAIESFAFKHCIRLTSVSLGEGLETIGRGAFANAGSGSVDSSETVQGTLRITLPSTLKTLGQSAFAGNQNLGEAIFRGPLGKEKTGASAFSGCEHLKKVVLAEGHAEISERMFSTCFALEEIAPPLSLTKIAKEAFIGDRALPSISVPRAVDIIGASAFKDCDALGSVHIADGVREIGANAFDECLSLSAISVPGSVGTIGAFAFKDCTALTTIELGEGIREIGAGAFSLGGRYGYEKGGLRVTLPRSLERVGTSLFYANDRLEEIVFLSTLSDDATLKEMFSGCDALTRVALPPGLTAIGERMFENCRQLASLTLPASASSVGAFAFYNCRSLASISLPSGVTAIGDRAFSRCRGLREVTVPAGAAMKGWPFDKGTVVHVSGAVPEGCKPSGTVSVPEGDTAWRAAVAAAKGVVVEDVAFQDEGLTVAQRAYCLESVQAGETWVRVEGDAATVSVCDALGIAPKRTVASAKARAAGGGVTLTFATPRVEVVGYDVAGRTLTVRVTPGEGTRREAAFSPSRFVAEGGPSLAELARWRVLAESAAGTDEELSAEERAYVSSGLVTFRLPEAGEARAMFWRAVAR